MKGDGKGADVRRYQVCSCFSVTKVQFHVKFLIILMFRESWSVVRASGGTGWEGRDGKLHLEVPACSLGDAFRLPDSVFHVKFVIVLMFPCTEAS